MALIGITMAVGVGVAAGVKTEARMASADSSFNTTYGYSDAGTSWTETNFEDATSYWKSSDSSNCIATVADIFTGKTITSDVVITLDVACYGNGTNPSSSKFSIYTSSALTTQVTATQTGSLPSSSSFVNTIYTVTKDEALSKFSDDLAIKVASGTKLIRFRSFTIAFSYTASSSPTIVLSKSTLSGYSGSNETITFTYANLTSDPISIGVVSSNTNKVTISDLTYSDGSGSVKINFAAKTDSAVTVSFKDGGNSGTEITTCAVTVYQGLNAIIKTNFVSNLTFTAKCNGKGTADDGVKWTVTSDASESTFDDDRGIHYGTSSDSVTYIQLNTSDISGTVTKVVVNASGNNTPKLKCTVGGVDLATEKTGITTTNTAYTFEGSKTAGEIVVKLYKAGNYKKAIFIKSVEVTYTGERHLENSADHVQAQTAVVTFAQAFNTAMNGTNVCSGTKASRSTGWATAKAAYGTLTTSLSSKATELAYAKLMIANATAVWNESHDSDEKYCLERAMKTYEYCVSHYDDCAADDFLVDGTNPLRGTNPNIYELNNTNTSLNNSTTLVIIVISAITLIAVSSYFAIRRRKENN